VTSVDDDPGAAQLVQDYRNLPLVARLDETIASVDPDPVPDPEAGRNVDQHRALRFD
jgi:hypothetical protein